MKTRDLLIKDSTLLVRYDQVKTHTDLAIANGKILELGPGLWKKYQACETISKAGKLFMPGLIDCHTHTGQQLLKGLVPDAKPIIQTTVGVALFNSIFIGIPACIGYMTQCSPERIFPVMAAALLFHGIDVTFDSKYAIRISQVLLKRGIGVFAILMQYRNCCANLAECQMLAQARHLAHCAQKINIFCQFS